MMARSARPTGPPEQRTSRYQWQEEVPRTKNIRWRRIYWLTRCSRGRMYEVGSKSQQEVRQALSRSDPF
jgi:hypothetical protein